MRQILLVIGRGSYYYVCIHSQNNVSRTQWLEGVLNRIIIEILYIILILPVFGHKKLCIFLFYLVVTSSIFQHVPPLASVPSLNRIFCLKITFDVQVSLMMPFLYALCFPLMQFIPILSYSLNYGFCVIYSLSSFTFLSFLFYPEHSLYSSSFYNPLVVNEKEN